MNQTEQFNWIEAVSFSDPGLVRRENEDSCTVLGEDEYSERLRRLLLLRGEEPKESLEVAPEEDLFHAMCRKVMEEDRVITYFDFLFC